MDMETATAIRDKARLQAPNADVVFLRYEGREYKVQFDADGGAHITDATEFFAGLRAEMATKPAPTIQ